jgi:hypothetical protein
MPGCPNDPEIDTWRSSLPGDKQNATPNDVVANVLSA